MHAAWLVLLLPIAASSGWFAAISSGKKQNSPRNNKLSNNYLKGVNFILNDQPDKALEFFITTLVVDSTTIETHLSLGSLFCRRGEVDRAIRIHQNIVACANLDAKYRFEAMLALARDYLSAGMFDRAEKLFLELIAANEYKVKSLYCLLDIYQQEKDWHKAIQTANNIKLTINDEEIDIYLAHYYCEIATSLIKQKDFELAAKSLYKALSFDINCSRANLLLADIEAIRGNYNLAINHLKNIKKQNPDFFVEALLPLANAYRALGKDKDFSIYLQNVLQESAGAPALLLLPGQIVKRHGKNYAINLVANYVKKNPSIAGLHRLLEMNLNDAGGTNNENLTTFYNVTEKLLFDQPVYKCIHCGFSGKQLHWHCPSCRKWSTIRPIYALNNSESFYATMQTKLVEGAHTCKC